MKSHPPHNNIYWFYATRVRVGSQAEEVIAMLDTGSNNIWLSCLSNSGCPTFSVAGFNEPTLLNPANIFPCSDQACSYCSENNQFSYSTTFPDNSDTSGYYARDMLSFDVLLWESSVATNISVSFTIGCSTRCTGDFSLLGMDGILGFGPGPNSFVSQVSAAGLAPPVFSICLRDDNSGGTLIFGEILEPSVSYTLLLPSQSNYGINLEGVSINGEKIMKVSPNNKVASVETGATYGWLVEEAYNPLVNAITAAVAGFAMPTTLKGKSCYYLINSTVDGFPQISLDFEAGATLGLKPDQYLKISDIEGEAEIWCIMFFPSPSTTVLGDLFLKEKLFVFDPLRGHLGMREFNCSLPIHVGQLQNQNSTTSSGASLYPEFFLSRLLLCMLLTIVLF